MYHAIILLWIIIYVFLQNFENPFKPLPSFKNIYSIISIINNRNYCMLPNVKNMYSIITINNINYKYISLNNGSSLIRTSLTKQNTICHCWTFLFFSWYPYPPIPHLYLISYMLLAPMHALRDNFWYPSSRNLHCLYITWI